MMTSIQLSTLVTQLDSASVEPQPNLLPIEFLSTSGALKSAVNNDGSKPPLILKNDEFEIKFDHPVFVTNVVVELALDERVRGMKLTGHDLLSGKQNKAEIEAITAPKNIVNFIPNRALTSFKIIKGNQNQKTLVSLKIKGIYLNEINQFEETYENLTELKSGIKEEADNLLKSIEEQQTALAAQVTVSEVEQKKCLMEAANARSTKSNLEAQIKNLKSNMEKLEGEHALKLEGMVKLEQSVDDRNKQLITVNSEIEQKTQTLSDSNVEISKQERKLKELVNDTNVFTEEFSSFIEQGANQVKTYLLLAAIPLLVTLGVVGYLFFGAVDLTVKFNQIENIDLLTLLMTRLPFVIIAGIVVGYSAQVVIFLAGRIIEIHQQRLDLAKVTILAKDVSDASASGVNLSGNDLYEHKIYLKMCVLRSYMAGALGSFRYEKKGAEFIDVEMPEAQKIEA